MLLNNYIKAYKQNLLSYKEGVGYIVSLGYQYRIVNGNTVSLSSSDFGGINPLIQPTASTVNISTSLPTTSTESSSNRHIVFGDGDTPPTLDDYTISGNVIPNIRYVTLAGSTISNGVRQSYVFTNHNSTPITIKEVCIFGSFDLVGSSYSLAMWREVFSTPLTVEAGTSFIYNIDVVTEV